MKKYQLPEIFVCQLSAISIMDNSDVDMDMNEDEETNE